MPKKNSLKIAPFAKYTISHTDYDEAMRPPGYDSSLKSAWDAYYASGVVTVDYEGMTLMEYTSGSPGEQSTRGWGKNGTEIEWRDNVPFEATLKLVSLERGRSAARFWWLDEENKTRYPMFGQSLVDTLTAGTLDKGVMTGTWIIVKKGANYGIELYV